MRIEGDPHTRTKLCVAVERKQTNLHALHSCPQLEANKGLGSRTATDLYYELQERVGVSHPQSPNITPLKGEDESISRVVGNGPNEFMLREPSLTTEAHLPPMATHTPPKHFILNAAAAAVFILAMLRTRGFFERLARALAGFLYLLLLLTGP